MFPGSRRKRYTLQQQYTNFARAKMTTAFTAVVVWCVTPEICCTIFGYGLLGEVPTV